MRKNIVGMLRGAVSASPHPAVLISGGFGHVGRKEGEMNGVTLCYSCANRFAEEYARRVTR